MNKKLASLLLKIGANGAQAIKELKVVDKSVEKFAKSCKKYGSTLTKSITLPLTALAGVSIKTADTQLKAEAKLLNALKGREEAQRRLMSLASEIQGRTLFGDEELINQMAILAAMGRTEEQIRDIIEASVQLSAATGMSLDSAVKNLAKTYGGLAGELGESIPALRTLTKEQLQNGDAVKLINEQYKGFAETAAQTGTGSLVQLKNKFGDLTEQIGIILMPILDRLVEILTKIVDWFSSLDKETQKSIVNWGLAAAAIGPLVSSFGSIIGVVRNFVKIAPLVGSAVLSWIGPLAAVAFSIRNVIKSFQLLRNKDKIIADAVTEQRLQHYHSIQDSIRAEAPSMSDDTLDYWLRHAGEDAAKAESRGDSLLAEHHRAIDNIYAEEAARRKAIAAEIQQAAKLANIPFVGGSLTSGLAEADGLIGKLTTRISELQAMLPWAKSTEEIASMNAEIERLQSELQRLQELKPKQNVITDGVAAVNPMFNADGFMSPISKVKVRLSETSKLWQEFNNNMEQEANRTVDIGSAIGEALGNMAMTSLTKLGEILGNLMNMPEGGMENPLATILNIIGSSLRDLGVALISYSSIVAKIKAALSTLWTTPAGTVAGIAIGVGAIAAGTALMNQAAKLPKLAKGGLAYAPTLAVVGDNPGATSDPEVIAPLSKLRSYMGGQRLQLVGNVAFELHGDVARAVLNRENARIISLG